MKAMNAVLAVLLVGMGLGTGWWWRGRSGHVHADAAVVPGTRKVRIYQSPMHPWITSPEPGVCTICGMKLVPVYEGEAGFDSAEGVLRLGSNSITAVGIASAPVEIGRVVKTLRLAGTLDDDDSRHRILSAYVEGRIESVTVASEGVDIREGTELATLYSPPLLGAVREYVSLASGGETGPLLAAAALRLRQMGLGEAQVKALSSGFAAEQRTLPWLSPMSGTVVKRMVYAGQWVKEGDPMFEVADFGTMWFKGDAYERDLPWLRVGQPVVLTTPSLPGQLFTNRIAFIDPNLDMMTRSTRIRVELPNPDLGDGRGRLFRHRLYAEARVLVQSEPVLVVPRAAVLNPGGVARVWVERGPGSYQERTIRVGRVGDAVWEVVEGLDAGERVVLNAGVLGGSSEFSVSGFKEGETTPPDVGGGGKGTPPDVGDYAAKLPVASSQIPDGKEAKRPVPDADRGRLMRVLAGMAAELAKDDLAGFNQARVEWGKAVVEVRAKGTNAPPDVGGYAEGMLVELPEARDLGSARKAFHGLVEAWAPTVLGARKQEGFGDLKVYRCPMTAKAFPGAPAKAVWWQFGGPLRNPWFGAEMLDCGTEVP
jgi:Cu(I)/Ag(I) efflux system membrane fusion protein